MLELVIEYLYLATSI